MCTRFSYFVLVACLALAGTVHGADPKKASPRAAADDLTGKWKATAHYYDGRPWPGRSDQNEFAFQGGKAYQVGVMDGVLADAKIFGRYSVNSSKKPKEIDLVNVIEANLSSTRGNRGRKQIAGVIWMYVYEIRDDKLILCCADHAEVFAKKEADGKFYNESKRPTAISSANHVDMWVLKRVRPGSAEDVWTPADAEKWVKDRLSGDGMRVEAR